MQELKILVAESKDFSSEAVAILRNLGNVSLEDLHRDDLLAQLHDVDVLWVRLRNFIDREVIDSAPHLKFIVSPTTGLNHIDLDYASTKRVATLSLRNEIVFLRNIRASSEHTVALLLSLIRNIPSAFDNVRNGYWLRDPYKGSELHEKTVGLIGFGRIGRLVARFLHPFGCKILTTDPHVDFTDIPDYVDLVTPDHLLQTSDIISIHVNLNNDTNNFFGLEQFKMMKTGSLLINTSRGELIDEDALLSSLQSGKLAGAALDVLCAEDRIMKGENPLISYAIEHNNLLITPHIGGCTTESMAKTEIFMAKKLSDRVHNTEGLYRCAE